MVIFHEFQQDIHLKISWCPFFGKPIYITENKIMWIMEETYTPTEEEKTSSVAVESVP